MIRVLRANPEEETPLALSLAILTHELRTASPEVRAILAEAVLGRALLSSLYCLQTLLVVDPDLARETAARVEGVPCDHGEAPWDSDPRTLGVTVRNRGWDAKNERYYLPCCWVTAAVR
jgi:hypothetical protein